MMHALRCALSLTLFSLVLGEKGPSGRTPRVLIYTGPRLVRRRPGRDWVHRNVPTMCEVDCHGASLQCARASRV